MLIFADCILLRLALTVAIKCLFDYVNITFAQELSYLALLRAEEFLVEVGQIDVFVFEKLD